MNNPLVFRTSISIGEFAMPVLFYALLFGFLPPAWGFADRTSVLEETGQNIGPGIDPFPMDLELFEGLFSEPEEQQYKGPNLIKTKEAVSPPEKASSIFKGDIFQDNEAGLGEHSAFVWDSGALDETDLKDDEAGLGEYDAFAWDLDTLNETDPRFEEKNILAQKASPVFKVGILQDDEAGFIRYSPRVFAPDSDSSNEETDTKDSQDSSLQDDLPGDPVMFPGRRGLSSLSGKLKRSKIKRDRRFKLPKSKLSIRKKRKKIRLKDIQPPSISATYYAHGTDEAELERVLNEEINQLFRLLKKSRTADLILRLGGLYVEKARLISFKLETDHERKTAAFLAGKGKKPPALNLRAAQVYNEKSLKLFENFRQNYPRHKRMDEVLFFLGFNFYQLDREDDGIRYFSELESRFPQSPYIYESRFQLGEHYFRLGQWQNSYKYYKKIATNKRGKFYFFALYKMAWSAYKMGKASQGLKILAGIIREGRKFTVVSDTNQVFTFTTEAIEDLVLFYTYSLKTPAQAKSFFLSLLDEKNAWRSLKRLAYVYRDAGRPKGVLTVFKDLIRKNPRAEEAFEYKYQMVETLYEQGRPSEIVKGFEEWVSNYGPKSAWAGANKGNVSLMEKSSKLQELTIRNYGLKNHETFIRTKNKRAKALALAFYKMYFGYFAESRFADQMHFFYGELLFDSGKFVSAGKIYENVISLFPKSKFTKPAFVNQILALEKALPRNAEIRRLVGKKESPVDPPKSIKAFMSAAERYTVRFPSEKNIPSIIYRMAVLYYQFNQFSLSAKYFEKLSDKYPRSENARHVGGILLDIYSKAKDYPALERTAFKLLKNKNAEPSILKEARAVLEQISFKRAQDLALKGKHAESAALYKKFALQFPASPLSAGAFYNAGLNFEKGGDRFSALSMYDRVLSYKGPKQAKLRKNAQESLAVLNEKLGFYKKAAESYVSFAGDYPSDPKAPDFWYNAGVIFDAFNDTNQAVAAYKKHLNLSSSGSRYDVHYLIGLLFEKNRRWQSALQSYSAYLNSPAVNKVYVMKAADMTARIYAHKLKNPTQAKLWREKTVNLYQKLKVGVTQAGGARFSLAQTFYDRFHAIRLPRDPRKQPSALQKKIRLLKELEEALRPVIRYDDGEWIIAALALTARANEEMARTIWKAPVPKALDKEGRRQYKEGIKKLIAPYRESAQKTRLMALQKAQSLKVYSEWIGEVYTGLKSARVERKTGFQNSPPVFVSQEYKPFVIVDDTGSVTKSFLASLSGSLKYGLSRSDFESLSRAAESKRESRVLKAVSSILNKDINNIPAINSLALFYLNQNRWGPAELILNRLTGKKNSPVILNNMAVIALKRKKPREAVAYLKKALAVKSSYHPAQINWGNVFIQQGDWNNALRLYERGFEATLRSLPSKGEKARALLNNYGIALTGAGKWARAEAMFKRLSRGSSPGPDILLNHAVLLTEKARGESDRAKALKALMSAKALAREVSLSNSFGAKQKAGRLSSHITGRLRALASARPSKNRSSRKDK